MHSFLLSFLPPSGPVEFVKAADIKVIAALGDSLTVSVICCFLLQASMVIQNMTKTLPLDFKCAVAVTMAKYFSDRTVAKLDRSTTGRAKCLRNFYCGHIIPELNDYMNIYKPRLCFLNFIF